MKLLRCSSYHLLCCVTTIAFVVLTIAPSWIAVLPNLTATQSTDGTDCRCNQLENIIDIEHQHHVDIQQPSARERKDGMRKNDEMNVDRTTVSDTNVEDDTVPETVTSIQERRQRLLIDACHKFGHTMKSSEPSWNEMYYDDQLHYVYCLVSKASCTSWKRTLMMLSGNLTEFRRSEQVPIELVHNYLHSDKYIQRLSKLSQVHRDWRAGSYFTFMSVREPLERLVSAYRDKLSEHNGYRKIDLYIVRHYRRNDYHKKVRHYNVTFAEFVQYVLDQRARGKQLDRHWVPQNELCQPCHIRYDFVGHHETLHDDAEFVVSKLKSRIQDTERRRMVEDVTFPADSGHRKSNQFLQKMYATVPAAHIRALFRLYAVDYALFGFQHPNVTGVG